MNSLEFYQWLYGPGLSERSEYIDRLHDGTRPSLTPYHVPEPIAQRAPECMDTRQRVQITHGHGHPTLK